MQCVCSTFLSTFQQALLVHDLTSKHLQWIKGREYIKKKKKKTHKKRVVIRNKLSWYDKGILWCFNNLSDPFSQKENWTLDKQTAHEQIHWMNIGNSLRVERYDSACVLYLALNIQITIIIYKLFKETDISIIIMLSIDLHIAQNLNGLLKASIFEAWIWK